jgi:hypothetical protein
MSFFLMPHAAAKDVAERIAVNLHIDPAIEPARGPTANRGPGGVRPYLRQVRRCLPVSLAELGKKCDEKSACGTSREMRFPPS